LIGVPVGAAALVALPPLAVVALPPLAVVAELAVVGVEDDLLLLLQPATTTAAVARTAARLLRDVRILPPVDGLLGRPRAQTLGKHNLVRHRRRTSGPPIRRRRT
jgi:hypothetical protein